MSREGRKPSHFQTYLNRHINDAKRDDDDDEDWSGQADHDQGADDAQEAQNPAAQRHGEGVIHRGDILGTHKKERCVLMNSYDILHLLGSSSEFAQSHQNANNYMSRVERKKEILTSY